MRFLLLTSLLLAGCVTDQTRQDIANSAECIANAAASLPISNQTLAIHANAVAIAAAVGHPIAAPALTPPTGVAK